MFLLYMCVCLLQYLVRLPVTISLQAMGGLMPDAMACAPPEVKKGGWSILKEYVIGYEHVYPHILFSYAHAVGQYQLRTDTPSACFSTPSSILPIRHPRLPSRPIRHPMSLTKVPYPRLSFPPSKNSSIRTQNHECRPIIYSTSEWRSLVEKGTVSLYIIASSRFVLDWTCSI